MRARHPVAWRSYPTTGSAWADGATQAALADLLPSAVCYISTTMYEPKIVVVYALTGIALVVATPPAIH